MSHRLKGQEVRLNVTGPRGLELGLTDVLSFEVELQLETLSEGFLGEKTERKDDIFRGVRGNFEIQIEQAESFRFLQAIKDRSQRRTPADTVFNAIGTFDLPSGERVRGLVEDMFFGAVPIQVPARDEYVTIRIEYEASEFRFLF